MKRLVPALLLFACDPRLAELEALNVALDKQLAEKMALANNLNEFRRASERLEQQLKEAAAGLDGGLPPLPTAGAAPDVTEVGPTPLPPTSAFETERSTRLRARIEETRRRIAELDKVLGEEKSINRRNAELYRQLELINELRKGRNAAAPAP